MSKLMESAERVSALAGAGNEFADTLVEAAPEVNEFLASCGDCSEPCPDNPNAEATEDEQKAWQDAHKLKSFAGQANEHHKNQMAHRIRKHKRKNGTPISESEARSLAHALVSNAQTQSQEDTAAALLESRQS